MHQHRRAVGGIEQRDSRAEERARCALSEIARVKTTWMSGRGMLGSVRLPISVRVRSGIAAVQRIDKAVLPPVIPAVGVTEVRAIVDAEGR